MTDHPEKSKVANKTAELLVQGLEQGAGELVPGVTKDLATYEQVDPEERAEIEALMAEIDLHDANSIIFYGAKAQQHLTSVSDQMLEGVKNKDMGRAGDALSEMVATMRGFDLDEIDPNKRPGFFARLFGKAKPLMKFLQRYEQVKSQIETITDKLEGHKTELLTDITSLDRLYSANLEYFHTLERYIQAGSEKLRQIDDETLPRLSEEASSDSDMLKSQELRDLRSARDDLDRRIHDLRLTRQVTMQSLPSIRLVQENDKGLVNKINSTLANTIPLWRQQLAQTVAIWRSHEASDTLQGATDLTNELLEANAENLKDANAQIRRQIERGVFDIETVKKANQTLIDTINESLEIADEGKRMRESAVHELAEAEMQLKQTLQAASARAAGG